MMDMTTRFKLAARNAVRNRRRSIATLASVVIGFVALSLFEGYFVSVYSSLEDEVIVGERLGHLTVAKPGMFDKGSQDPRRYAFTENELAKATATLKAMRGVKLVSPRIAMSGLVSNGDTSRIYIGEGMRAEDMIVLRGEKYADQPGKLDPRKPQGAVFGRRLAESLGLKAGNDATLLGATLDGMVNAVGIQVLEASATGSLGTDDKFILTSLDTARRLMAYEGAERIVLLLEPGTDLAATSHAVTAALAAEGIQVEVRDWRTLSVYYNQVKNLFDMMYLFISVVVAIVVLASVFNTMGMTITERTREIGTLRALGMQVRTLDGLFVLEGMLIVAIGCVAGIAVTLAAGALINGAGITYMPPDAAAEVPLVVKLVAGNLVGSLFTLVVLAALASYLPARRASRRNIVGALSHV
jgi:putative ABC transport system permease protein